VDDAFRVTLEEVPLAFEPSCEQEVVAAFSAIARRLGFVILDLGTAFPDCRVRKLDTEDEVRVEFEYRSSDFIKHGHPSDGCDLVVCWEEDVSLQSPDVIALKEYCPPLPPKPWRRDRAVNVHEVVIARASDRNGVSYPELVDLLGMFHERNVNEPLRCLARLFKWGCFPYASEGRLRIRNLPPVRREYSVQQDEVLMGIAGDLLELLREQWGASYLSQS